MEYTIQDFTKDGKCSSCGQCCSNLLPLSNNEIRKIKEYIKKHGIKEQRHNFMVGYDMTCPFRNEAKRICEIYDVRPAICREFQCNNKAEDIQRSKISFHNKHKVVYMRNEFFKNNEDETYIRELLKELQE